MLRWIFRFTGFWLLTAAFAGAVYDGIRSIGADAVLMTSVAEAWRAAHGESLIAFQNAVAQRHSENLWRSVFQPLLEQPAWALAALLGATLLLLGARRRRRRAAALPRTATQA